MPYIQEFNTYGQLISATNAKNQTTSYLSDEWNRLKNVNNTAGKQVFEYDIYSHTKLTYFLPASNPYNAENHYMEAYDQLGRIISRTGYPYGKNDPRIVQEKYEYDLVGVKYRDYSYEMYKENVDGNCKKVPIYKDSVFIATVAVLAPVVRGITALSSSRIVTATTITTVTASDII